MMNYFNYILLFGQTTGEDQNPLGMFLPLILVLVIFWFFMIRPQAKKQKELRKFRESIQKGDKVITTGGIYGKISSVKDTSVILQIDENTKITVDKNSIIKDPTDLQQGQK